MNFSKILEKTGKIVIGLWFWTSCQSPFVCVCMLNTEKCIS